MDFNEYFENEHSQHDLMLATKVRNEMITALQSGCTSIQKKTAVEQYIPYAQGLVTSIKSQEVILKKKILYKWTNFLNESKTVFENPQINFELAMTLVTYAYTLSECAIDTASDFLKLEAFSVGTSSDEKIAANAKECSQLFKKAAGVVSYVEKTILPLIDPSVRRLPVELSTPGLSSLQSCFLAQAQAFALMLGSAQNKHPLALARISLGCAQLMKQATEPWKISQDLKNSLLSSFYALLGVIQKHFTIIAYKYLSSAELAKNPMQAGKACCYILEAIKVNSECLQVTDVSSGVKKIISDMSAQLKKDIDFANERNQHVCFQQVPTFPPDTAPEPAIIATPTDFDTPQPAFLEIH